jgi:uncharacterized membrane protein
MTSDHAPSSLFAQTFYGALTQFGGGGATAIIRLMLFTTVKFVHILLAITAVGFNASYAIWTQRAARSPEHLGFALRGVKFMDDRVANPAYGLLLLSGLTMVFVGHLSLTTFWIGAALVLWLVVVVLGLVLYTPTLRRQIQALEAHGPGSAEYTALASRSAVAGIATSVVVLAIIVLMVFKPGS